MPKEAPKPPPTALVIFGATGDLTRRKLVPALLGLGEEGLAPDFFRGIAFARREKSDEEFRTDLRDALTKHNQRHLLGRFDESLHAIRYLRGDFHEPDGYPRLAEELAALDQEHGSKVHRLFYLATPPSAYPSIIENLRAVGLNEEEEGRSVRIIIEKPFGHDLSTAQALNGVVASAFDERQVFRIDHYLGKETVQNILALRFANSIFEPMWNQKYIDHVQITVAESIGIEGRGDYFEEAGIIRDIIQNHAMQVMTLIAMEPPATLDPDAVRDEKVKVLRSIASMSASEVLSRTARGQYSASAVAGRDLIGYHDENGVAPDSSTETYAAIRFDVDNWRWAGVPFFLRSGKSMPKRMTEVVIHFRQPPHMLFGGKEAFDSPPNALVLQIQPDEGISMHFGGKRPGMTFDVAPVRMDFRYSSVFGGTSADAYQRLLYDAMTGDSTLFARRDELEEAWRLVDAIVAGWEANDQRPAAYPAGSWGPSAADRVLGADRSWHNG